MNWRYPAGLILSVLGTGWVVALCGAPGLIGVVLVTGGVGWTCHAAALSGHWPPKPGRRVKS